MCPNCSCFVLIKNNPLLILPVLSTGLKFCTTLTARGPTSRTCTSTQSCVRCILRTSYCSPLLFPLLLDLNLFRHLPLDLYTFFNRGHLLTITANRGPIVPLCYKSSVYPLHIPTIRNL